MIQKLKVLSRYFLVFWIFIFFYHFLPAQNSNTNSAKKIAQAKSVQTTSAINDANTPLHLLKPDYAFDYGIPDTNAIKSKLKLIYSYLSKITPAKLEDNRTNTEITDYNKIDRYTQLTKGDFRLTSYEWGVTYSGMLRMAEISRDTLYSSYVYNRLNFLADITPQFKKILNETGIVDKSMMQVLKPKALDDAGAICAAMIKASLVNKNLTNLRPLIDNYLNYIMYGEYRLGDGTFARNRPHRNSVWLDDMFMSIPAIIYMGKLTDNQKYYNEAVRQVKQFNERMFVPGENLFRHSWVEGLNDQPSYFWGRANGWALLTLCEVLDVLPQSHPSRPQILEILESHIRGLAACQSGQGLWHQLLNKPDSYLETSASAIFVYGIAHAINKGWIDGNVYGPVALAGWSAVTSKINDKGQVEGTCVGTGVGFDPVFYCHRPVSAYAAHGYGTVLLAGAEIIELSRNWQLRLNDSAIQFYTGEQPLNQPLFSEQDNTRPPALIVGSTRKGDKPVVLIIGDSTVKNGKGKGDNDQWGWGSLISPYFDTTRISVENHALGGRSSRTFITEGLWDKVLNGLKKGDYLLIQFGHNDGGSLNTGRARASLAGTGEETQTVIMERHGGPEEVHTFGYYLRTYIRQAKAQGAIPIILSPTPRNKWENNTIDRYSETYTKWSKEVATEEGVFFIDLNEISAQKCEKLGKEKVQRDIFRDSVHTSEEGAIMNCESIIDALTKIEDCGLGNYIKNKLN